MAPHYVTHAGVFSTVTGLEFRVPMQKLLLQGPEKKHPVIQETRTSGVSCAKWRL